MLAPSSARGWFGGQGLVASRPAEQHAGLSLAEAGTHLEAAFRGDAPGLTAVLASYDGGCSVVRFEAVTPLAPDTLEPGAHIAPATSLLEDAEWDLSGREYRAAVREARERIAAGDVYVLNLTARLTGRPIAAPAELFAALVGARRCRDERVAPRMAGGHPVACQRLS